MKNDDTSSKPQIYGLNAGSKVVDQNIGWSKNMLLAISLLGGLMIVGALVAVVFGLGNGSGGGGAPSYPVVLGALGALICAAGLLSLVTCPELAITMQFDADGFRLRSTSDREVTVGWDDANLYVRLLDYSSAVKDSRNSPESAPDFILTTRGFKGALTRELAERIMNDAERRGCRVIGLDLSSLRREVPKTATIVIRPAH
jgi:hypothetical protein